eukprot:scaffold1037_cov157-Amphora_coffeaeformis.AAC.11
MSLNKKLLEAAEQREQEVRMSRDDAAAASAPREVSKCATKPLFFFDPRRFRVDLPHTVMLPTVEKCSNFKY